MRRNWINLLIALAAGITMTGTAVSGFILRYGLPPGGGRRHGRGGAVLWGWSRHDWCDVHFWLATVTIGLLLVHTALHWNWLRGMYRQLRRSNGASGVVRPTTADART
ncbi:MAG: DUF4405 domain-containing protein [Phycisphaerae bacterium]